MSEQQAVTPGRNAGRGRDGRENHGHGMGRHCGQLGQKRFNKKRFEGMEPTLKGKAFNFSEDTHSKQYSKNVKAIMRYIGTNYKQCTADLVRSVKVL